MTGAGRRLRKWADSRLRGGGPRRSPELLLHEEPWLMCTKWVALLSMFNVFYQGKGLKFKNEREADFYK